MDEMEISRERRNDVPQWKGLEGENNTIGNLSMERRREEIIQTFCDRCLTAN